MELTRVFSMWNQHLGKKLTRQGDSAGIHLGIRPVPAYIHKI